MLGLYHFYLHFSEFGYVTEFFYVPDFFYVSKKVWDIEKQGKNDRVPTFF
jgi:hypothetical protein